MTKVMRDVAESLGWRARSFPGRVDHVPDDVDLALCMHSQVDADALGRPVRGVHLVRDPRDVWVSGYLYHLRCRERWCVEAPPAGDGPIRFPRVPYSLEHLPEADKAAYLETLGGRSYQEVLHALEAEAGLRFELDHYARWTIEAMAAWPYGNDPRFLEVRLEALADDYDGVMASILAHLETPVDRIDDLIARVRRHDVQRMSAQEVARSGHIFSRGGSKWQTCLTPALKAAFSASLGFSLPVLGYDEASGW